VPLALGESLKITPQAQLVPPSLVVPYKFPAWSETRVLMGLLPSFPPLKL